MLLKGKNNMTFKSFSRSSQDTEFLYWVPNTMGTQNLHFRGYNPYVEGLNPSFFMVLGSKGTIPKLATQTGHSLDMPFSKFHIYVQCVNGCKTYMVQPCSRASMRSP